jgi:hypothetical protein
MTRATRHSDPPRTLAKCAVTGGGPPYRKAGRYPLYHPDDLDGWLGGKLSDPVTSTSALRVGSAPAPQSKLTTQINKEKSNV